MKAKILFLSAVAVMLLATLGMGAVLALTWQTGTVDPQAAAWSSPCYPGATQTDGSGTVGESDPGPDGGVQPGLTIEVQVNGQDADTPPGPTVTVGSTVSWMYMVTTTDGSFDHVMVVDDHGTPCDPADDLRPGFAPTFAPCDSNTNGALDPGETWIYLAHGTAVAGQYANTGTVSGVPHGGLEAVTARDRSHYFGLSPPTPWFTAEPTTGVAPLKVQFTQSLADDALAAPAWDFGDGGTSTGRNPVHIYAEAGTYTVTLTVTAADGSVGSVQTGSIRVLPEVPPVGGDRGYFLVSTTPVGADVYLEDLSGARYWKGTTAAGPLNVTVLLTATPVKRIIANLRGYHEAAWDVVQYPPRDQTVPVALTLEAIVPPTPGPAPLVGTWQLVSFLSADGGTVRAVPEPASLVTFAPDGTVWGTVGCNRFGARYTANGTSLTIDRLVSTMMYCALPADSMNQEQRVFELFSITAGYGIAGSTLTLVDGAGRALLTFERVPAVQPTTPELTGVPTPGPEELLGTWRLTTFLRANGEIVRAAPDQVSLVTFSPDGTVWGTVGCNRFSGSYTASGNQLTFGPITSTEMACPVQEIMDQEQRIFELFAITVAYKSAGTDLTLLDRNGLALMTFDRVPGTVPTTEITRPPTPDITIEPTTTITCPPPPPPDALPGTWQLATYLGANGEAIRPLPDPVSLVTFSPDGMVWGSTGCNRFSGSYSATGDQLTFGPLASTDMACPALGVMDQEQRILELFAATARFKVSGSDLVLLDGAGLPIMTFGRTPAVQPTIGVTRIPTPEVTTGVPVDGGGPIDPDADGLYDDVNGNGRADFADIVLYFNQMSWIAVNEPLAAFDYTGNGRIDFADVVWLFSHL